MNRSLRRKQQKQKNGKSVEQPLSSALTGLSDSQLSSLHELGNKSVQAFQAGDLPATEYFCQKALSLYSGYAMAWALLSNVSYRRQNYPQAAAQMKKSLDIFPRVAERWMSYSVALKNCHQYDEALVAIEKALKLDPNSPKSLNNKATLLNEIGEVDEAKKVMFRLLQKHPTYGKPYFNFATLHSFSSDDKYSERFERLSHSLDRLKSDEDKRHACFALGKYFEDIGKFQEAFKFFNLGNELSNQGVDYSVEADLNYLEEIKKIYISKGSWMSKYQKNSSSSDMPLYIIGMPRSGTSLVEQILASHKDVYGAGELTILPKLHRKLNIALGNQERDEVNTNKNVEIVSQLSEELFRYMRGLDANTRYVTDKLPMNFLALGAKHVLAPNAKVIHCTRDPIDTCLSNYKKLFEGKLYFTNSLSDLGKYYLGYLEIMEHWRNVLPTQNFIEINYEKLISSTETEIRRLLEFLDLNWDDACLEFHKHKRAVHTASTNQVRQPIYKSSIGQYERYGDLLNPLLKELEPLMKPDV